MDRRPIPRKAAPRQPRYGEVRACENCGKPFRGKYEHRNYRQKHCSNRCRAEARAKTHRDQWPSRETMLAHIADGLSDGAIGRIYGHSYEWARLVRKAYSIRARPRKPSAMPTIRSKGEIRCRVCRKVPRGGSVLNSLHLHHVIPRSLAPGLKREILNLIPLCFKCHQGWHDRSVTVYRDVFTAEEWAFLTSVQLVGRNIMPWLDRNYPTRTAR